MPIYEYVCQDCEHAFEELVRSNRDEKAMVCPSCSSKRVGRKLSVFAAQRDAKQAAATPMTGGCGRCGDPNGPCALG